MGEIFDVLDRAKMANGPIMGDYAVNLYPSEGSAKVGSSVYGKCLRAAFFRYKAAVQQEVHLDDNSISIPVQEKPNAKAQWIFEAGNRFESAIVDCARDAKILLQGHVKISIPVGGLAINGEIDAVFSDKHGIPVGIEIKSIQGSLAETAIIGNQGMRARRLKGEPKVEHVIQTAIYAWHLKEQIPRFKILYIMRDKCFREEFQVVVKEDSEKRKLIYVDNELWKYFTLDDVFDRYKKLAFHINSNTTPERDYTLIYDDNTMNHLFKTKQLPKGDSEKWDKYWEREQEYKLWEQADPQLRGKEPRQLKRPERGDWNCAWCSAKNLCYNKDNTPRGS